MKFKIIALISLLLIFISCARSGSHPVKKDAELKQETYSIRGEVLWTGPSPIVYPIPTTAYKGACGERKGFEMLELKSSRLWHKRLMDVAVWVEPVLEEMSAKDIENLERYKMAEAPRKVAIYEKECVFSPDMIVVPVGTKIEILNEDKKDHWFIAENDKGERRQYVQYFGDGPSVFTFDSPGVHEIPKNAPVEFVMEKPNKWHVVSGFHRWMDAWIIVTDKIWFDEKIDDKGLFEINNVPKGVYRVYSWHPILGENSVVIKVPEDIHGLVWINYSEDPQKIEKISSTITSTNGEVNEDSDTWNMVDEW